MRAAFRYDLPIENLSIIEITRKNNNIEKYYLGNKDINGKQRIYHNNTTRISGYVIIDNQKNI